jgi:transposase
LAVSPDRDRVRLFFRLYPQANINARKVLSFLKHLSRHFRCPLSLVWDRFMPHRAGCVKNFIARKKDWRLEFLPPYAPELNPTENVWCYLKTNSMANEALFEHELLTRSVRHHGLALQRKQILLRSLLKHTPLFLRLK